MSGQRTIKGLVKRGGVWHIQKWVNGQRIRESTGTSEIKEAEKWLIHQLEKLRKTTVYGERPRRIWKDAATKYLNEATKASLQRDADLLEILDKTIGNLPLQAVHMGTLQPYIEARRKAGWKKRTINYGLQVVRHILNLAAGEWMDEHGLTWLEHAPKIKLLREDDKAAPYPLSFEEQDRFFAKLPEHLRLMALFKVNTGCREAEVCNLRWEWEVPVPELNTSVFIIPAGQVKNRQDRLVVLNRVATAVIEEVRGVHPIYLFTFHGAPVRWMYNSAWKKARIRAALPQVRVHDLKHTFGRRLRAAGVSFEDRQDLLGHKSSRITTHYSRPELLNLIRAAETVCQGKDTLVVLRKPRLAVVR